MSNQGVTMTSYCQPPSSTPIFELFSDPPTYTLPEDVRSAMRELVAHEDIEWSRRHPECVRHKWDSPDSDRKWGPECKRCFSPVSAMEIIGLLETAIALHRALFRKGKHCGDFNAALQDISQQLSHLQNSLEGLLAIGWSRFFFSRGEFIRLLPVIERLRELLQKATLNQQTLQTLDIGPKTDSDPLLIALLGEILDKGSLFCFIVHTDNKAILSPGMEILLLCLNECGYFTSAQTVESILAVTSKPEGTSRCRI